MINYNMQDIFAVTDRIVILRHGVKAGERIAAESDVAEIVSSIVGAD